MIMTSTSFPESINIDVEAVQILCTESEKHFNLALSKMADFNAVEQRTIIKMCATLGKSPVDTMKILSDATGKPSVCRTLVYKWHRRFSAGRTSTEADKRSGRPGMINEGVTDSVREAIDTDGRVSIRELADRFGVGKTTIDVILKERLKMNKVCARWIPRILTEENKTNRVSASWSFLDRYRMEGDGFLDRIITTDETMINLFDPETKCESSVWKRKSSPPPLKARVSKSVKRTMFIFFMDRRGMLLVHAVPEGQSVNASYYSRFFLLFSFPVQVFYL